MCFLGYNRNYHTMNKPPIFDARNFLKKNFTAVLATSYLNLPYASTIYYTTDDKLNIYFVTKMNTDKYLNLKTNKNAALVIGTGPKHISVQMRGHATILKDKRWRNRILNEIESILKERGIGDWPIKKLKELQSKKKAFDEEIVYKFTPQHLVFTNLNDKSFPGSISDESHHILPLTKNR
jgi:general stress protein 26